MTFRLSLCLFTALITPLFQANATYVGNNPTRYVDPNGLSAEDVNRISQEFDMLIERLNAIGMRHPTNPAMNNFSRALNDINSNWGEPYLGCFEQSYAAQQRLSGLKYDDTWQFSPAGSNMPHFQPQARSGVGILPHHWIRAVSSNPTDPTLIIDPWNNIFMRLPHN